MAIHGGWTDLYDDSGQAQVALRTSLSTWEGCVRPLGHQTENVSPRAQGKLEFLQFGPLLRRCIPTRVGKAKFPPPAATEASAHPRMCGENVGDNTIEQQMTGTSSRVQEGQWTLARVSRVHLHVCEENSRVLLNIISVRNTSLRVWKNRARRHIVYVSQGASPRGRGKHL